MNRELGKFLKKEGFREPDGMIEDLYDEDSLSAIPKKPGVYIFQSKSQQNKSQKFVYPSGESQVIYIGMSKNLHSRIKDHHKTVTNIKRLSKSEILNDWHYTRYLYINSFGCQVHFFTTRGTQKEKNLESEIIEKFYDRFYALPIGNGAFSFKK